MKTAEQIIREKGKDFISVRPDATIYEALQVMVKNRIGAILIREDEEIIGIWTERDLMRNTLEENFDPRKAKIKDYMETGLKSAPHTDSILQLLDKFLGMRLRHLLIEKEGKYIGLVSAGDVVKAKLQEKTKELQELNSMMSWEYYENWRWSKKEGKK